jgi:hypothetical protein
MTGARNRQVAKIGKGWMKAISRASEQLGGYIGKGK